MTFSLRDYQEVGVGQIREAFQQIRNALYVLPTGGGKTRVFSYIAEAANSKGNPVCIVVHRQELVIQTSLSLAEIGVKHRIITSDAVIKQALSAHVEEFGRSFIDQKSRTIVASVQTLVRALAILKDVRLLIIDEAHHATAGSWDKCFKAATGARVLGVTATPIRMDGNGLGNHFQQMIVGVSMQELIDRGYLCTPKIYAPANQQDFSDTHTRFGDYVTSEIDKIMDKPMIIGDAVQHYKDLCDKVPAIAYCCSVRHAGHVAGQFSAAGYKSVSIDGTTDKMERRNAIRMLGRGEIHVLTACDIISEGTDIPLVGCGIMLRPTKSLGLFLQQAGRVLRPYPDNEVMQQPHMRKLVQGGKHFAYLLDHVGNTMVHGMPQMNREWDLNFVKKKNNKTEVPIRQCPKCFFIHEPADICPACGFNYLMDAPPPALPKTADGVLTEITAEWFDNGGKDVATAPLKRLVAAAFKSGDAETKLLEIEKIKGYKKGWAYHVMRSAKK